MRWRTFGSGPSAVGLAALLRWPGRAQAGGPRRTVRPVVPLPAGGTADPAPRIVAEAAHQTGREASRELPAGNRRFHHRGIAPFGRGRPANRAAAPIMFAWPEEMVNP